MLNILGQSGSAKGHCDGVSRRHFLKVGGMAAGGLSLAQLLGMETKVFCLTLPLNSSNHQAEQRNFNQLGDSPMLVLCCLVQKEQRI